MKSFTSTLPTLMSLPRSARIYVAAVIGGGAACLLAAAMHLRFDHPWLFACVAPAGRRHVEREDRSAARPQPVEPVVVACGQFLGAVRARAGADRLHRGGERLGAVHVPARAAKPAAPHRVQHRLADADGLGRRRAAGLRHSAAIPTAPPRSRARPRSSRRCISSSTRRSSPARSRSRPGSRWRVSGTATSCGARRAIWPARRSRRSRPGGDAAELVRVARAARGAAVSGLPQLPHGRRAAARRAGRNAPRDGGAARDDRGARARDRSEGGLARPSTSDRSSSTRPCSPRPAGCPMPRSRRSAPRRCCTTSATWRCRSTFCRSPTR